MCFVADWIPIAIVAEEVEGVPTPDRVALAFRLNCEPDWRWRSLFELAPWQMVNRSGSPTMRRPEVIGSSIRVVVDPASRGATTRRLQFALDAANWEYQTRVVNTRTD